MAFMENAESKGFTARDKMANLKSFIDKSINHIYRKNQRKYKMELTLEKLKQHLGMPRKKIGKEYIWQCPYCRDSGRDNLKFNEEKSVLYCFANDRHAKMILSDLFKSNGTLYVKSNKDLIKPIVSLQNTAIDIYSQKIQENFLQDMFKWNNILLQDKKALDFLYKKRGLIKDTVEFCKIGIDEKKRLWTIPTFKYDCEKLYITGFEYRPIDLSKKGLHRTKNTPNFMAMINYYTSQVEALVIVEGYLDGYALYQHLNELAQASYYHIVSPSNGVNSLLKYIPQIDFSKYKRYYLYIDNDKVSREKALQILEKYPFFELIIMTCGCKDFNEHYLKCIKGV